MSWRPPPRWRGWTVVRCFKMGFVGVYTDPSMYIRLSKHIYVCIYIYIHIHTYIYIDIPVQYGYIMLFLDILCYFWGTWFFFKFQDSGYETSYKNKHGWSFLIMQMGRSIKYSPMELKQLPFGGLTLMDQTTPKKLSPVFIAEPFFAPKFGWTSSSFREDVLRMTLLIAMRLNFWDVPKFLISKSIVSIRKMHQFVMLFWYSCLKKQRAIEPQIIPSSMREFSRQNCGIKLQAAAKLYPDHPGRCIKNEVLIVTAQKTVRCECMVDFSTLQFFFFIGLSFVCVSFI